MNGYIAFFHGREHGIYADTLYEAKKKAVEFFKPKKKEEFLITVVLCIKGDVPVTHSTTEI